MRYFLLLPIAILFEIIAKLLSPVLPLFAKELYGPGENKYLSVYEPRLPEWLDWFMMDDHSLLGTVAWRTKDCPKYWSSYLGMVLWLWRNSAVNFGRYPLAIEPTSPQAWQFHKTYQVTESFGIELNLGWKLDRVNIFNGLAAYVWAIRFKTQ